MRKLLASGLFAIVLLGTAGPALAIEQCRDYVWYWAIGGDRNGTSVQELRAELSRVGFKRFPFTHAAQSPERAMQSLRRGDVVMIDNGAHVGIVNTVGRIDHFIQLQGEVGKRRLPNELPLHRAGNAGGLFLSDGLAEMFSRRFKADPGQVEIWRITGRRLD